MEKDTHQIETDNEEQRQTCRGRVAHVLENKKVQTISLSLIVIDVIIVLCLLLVDLDVIPVSSGEEDSHKDEEKKKKVENALHYISLTILSIFMVEVCLKIYVERRNYFKQKLEVFDGVVVTVSFLLDIALTLSPVSRVIRDIAILMVILRLWRFLRIILAINIFVRKEVHNELELEKTKRKRAEEQRTQAERERDDAKENLKYFQQKRF